MTTPKTLNIAYPENQLTQRYLAARAVQGKELEFFMHDQEPVKGYITGIDDDNYQVCVSDGLNAELLSTRHVFNVRETGKTFNDLSPADAEEVKKYTKIFRRISENELSRPDDED